jgi:DNA-binding HxlR family transcriptional regulator
MLSPGNRHRVDPWKTRDIRDIETETEEERWGVCLFNTSTMCGAFWVMEQPQPTIPIPERDLLTPTVPLVACPMATSLGVLGRKWTMLILRDIGMMRKERFNEILRSTPGLTPRVLSHRLKELERDGLIRRLEENGSPNYVRWGLTEKGSETIPILMRFAAFGMKWYAGQVFQDKTPRRLREVYPAWEAQSPEKRYP